MEDEIKNETDSATSSDSIRDTKPIERAETGGNSQEGMTNAPEMGVIVSGIDDDGGDKKDILQPISDAGNSGGRSKDDFQRTTTMSGNYNTPKDFGERNPDDVHRFKEGESLREQSHDFSDATAYTPPSSVPLPPMRGVLKPREKGAVLRYLQGVWLADNLNRFAKYDLCEKALKLLSSQRIILLHGNDDTLVHQMALWLLYENLKGSLEADPFPAYNTTLRKGLSDFIDEFPYEEEGVYYLITNVTDLSMGNITSQHIEQIQHNLKSTNSFMVMTAEANKKISTSPLRAIYFFVDELPKTKDIINTVIRCEAMDDHERQALLKEISRADGENWQRLLEQPTTLEEMYALADRICVLWRKDPDKAFDKLFVENKKRQVQDWFNRHPDWSTRAYMLAIAVLDGAMPEEITDAYHDLVELWHETRLNKRPSLNEMLAGTRQTYEQNDTGRWVRVKVNGFTTHGLFTLVLYDVFDELFREDDRDRLDAFCDWLRHLATSKKMRVQNLAARAIGTLSIEYFSYIENKIIQPLIQRGAMLFATANLPELLRGILQYFVSEALKGESLKHIKSIWKDANLKDDNLSQILDDIDDEKLSQETAQNMLIASILDTHLKTINQATEMSLNESYRYFTVIGNILAYGIESDNAAYRKEVLELTSDLTNPAHRDAIVIKQIKPDQIRVALLGVIGQIDESLQNLVTNMINEKAFDKAIKKSLVVYQQIMGLAIHFYSGGYVVNRAMQDISRLTDNKSQYPHDDDDSNDYLVDLMGVLRTTIRGIIIKRMNLPGDPRENVNNILGIIRKWVDDGERIQHDNPNLSERDRRKSLLYFLGLDIFCELSFRVAEPLTQSDSGNLSDEDKQAHPLLRMHHTDWPLLLFLSLYSDATQDIVTWLLRHLISRNRPWPYKDAGDFWGGVTQSFLDKPRERGRQFDANSEKIDKDKIWSMRDQGFGILEYWMLFAVGRTSSDKSYIKRVKDQDQYIIQLKRIIAETLAWFPGEKTRAQLVKFLTVRETRGQTIAPVARQLLEFVDNYTNLDGTPKT